LKKTNTDNNNKTMDFLTMIFYRLRHKCANVGLLLTALLLPNFLVAQSERAVIDKVVATVGAEVILLSEVQEHMAYLKQQDPNLPADHVCMAMQNLLAQKLLVNQAKIDSIPLKDEEVEHQLEARVERLRVYFNQDEKAIEEYYGQTVTQIKDQMRNDMRGQLLAERMQGEITAKATISPLEVQAFFDKIPIDSLPYFNSEVEVRELVYNPPVNPEEKAKAKTLLEDLRRRIVEGGESFADLAKKHSADPGSGTKGGDLGWQKRGTFVAEFEAAVYKLDPNQISPIIETEFGFHLIQLLERRGNLVHARHILIKPEITEKDLEMAEAKLDSIRQLISSKEMTFTIAVKQFGDKNVASYNNDGRVANPRSGNTFFEVADLDTNIFFAIDGISPGEITEPIPYRAPDGTRRFRLVQLQSRSKPHKADLKQDYNKIQAAALEQKKGDYLEKWVLAKISSTYMTIGDPFNKCPNLQEMIQIRRTERP